MKNSYKIGFFDSGVGGLFSFAEVIKNLPNYSYIYFSDSKNMPYGNRSQADIFELSKKAVDYLFKQNCKIIIVACNTIASKALRRLQHEYLPKNYPDRKILGVLIPLAEQIPANSSENIVILATQATVKSGAYLREIKKVAPDAKIFQQACPDLASQIESGDKKRSLEILNQCLNPLLEKKISCLILGCTHFDLLAEEVKKLYPDIKIIYSKNILWIKLKEYLSNHVEIENDLDREQKDRIFITSGDLSSEKNKLRMLFENSAWFTEFKEF